MVWIPAGTFHMGSNLDHVQQAAEWCKCGSRAFEDELYMHEVNVGGFYIDKYEVTNRQYKAFADATGYRTDAEKKGDARTWRTEYTPGKDSHPVVWMSWNDAYAYCDWASKRLPTEAEWEKAARGNDARLWPWGSNWDSGYLNSSEGGRKATTPVGSFANGASFYGVMDMAGNVWEWVNDWHGAGYYQNGETSDPRGPEGGVDRVLRGGGYNNGIHDVRVANRHKGGQAGYAFDHGFRCAR
jgi:formylglycine-generating enzyme required for sulfatase activity